MTLKLVRKVGCCSEIGMTNCERLAYESVETSVKVLVEEAALF